MLHVYAPGCSISKPRRLMRVYLITLCHVTPLDLYQLMDDAKIKPYTRVILTFSPMCSPSSSIAKFLPCLPFHFKIPETVSLRHQHDQSRPSEP